VLVTYTAGYGTPQEVPDGILLALKYAVAQAYHGDRGDGGGKGLLTEAVTNALSQFHPGVIEYGEAV
jgi:hypothetical protein